MPNLLFDYLDGKQGRRRNTITNVLDSFLTKLLLVTLGQNNTKRGIFALEFSKKTMTKKFGKNSVADGTQ